MYKKFCEFPPRAFENCSLSLVRMTWVKSRFGNTGLYYKFLPGSNAWEGPSLALRWKARRLARPSMLHRQQFEPAMIRNEVSILTKKICTNFLNECRFRSFFYVHVSCQNNVRTKNSHVKCWWNWLQLRSNDAPNLIEYLSA